MACLYVEINAKIALNSLKSDVFQLFETSARLDSQCDNVEAIFLTLAHKLKYSKPFMRRTNNTVTINVQNSVEERQANDSWSCSVL